MAVNTYYFDGSDASVTDPDSAWSNDTNAFDGSTGTNTNTSSNGSISSNYLLAEGTNAPVSGETISQVRVRIYGSGGISSGTVNASIYTDALGELLGNAIRNSSTVGWGSYVTLDAPSGGWSWSELQSLEVKIFATSIDLAVNAYKVEIEVTSHDYVGSISTGADDGHWGNIETTFSNMAINLLMYEDAGMSWTSFMRFLNIDVPQGAIIDSAYLRFVSYGTYNNDGLDIWFNDIDDAVAPTDEAEGDALVLTTATTRDTTEWTTDSTYDVDVTDVVQEVVDRPGWSSGNAMMAIGKAYSTYYNRGRIAYSYDEGSGNEPILIIDYHANDTGWVSPGTVVNDSAVGTVAWSNPSNASASDDSYATQSSSGISHYLKATNFNFSIPSGATIDGIEVQIEKKTDPVWGNAQDSAVNIVKSDGSIGTTNKGKTSDYWTDTDTYYSYGGSVDLWGETWSDTDINDADFGVAFSEVNQVALIDHIQIKVYYTESSGRTTAPLPVFYRP